MTSSHKVGFVDILVLYDVYMIKEVNSLDRIFESYWKSLASRMIKEIIALRTMPSWPP